MRMPWEVKHKCANCGGWDAWLVRWLNGTELRFCCNECWEKWQRKAMVE